MSEGAVWVLLRGLTRESGHWGSFPAQLHAQLVRQQPGAKLILLDLPGNGTLHAKRSPSQVAALMESCREQLRSNAVPGPWVRWWRASG